MNQPNNITNLDYELLKHKYPNNMDQVEKLLSENYPVQYLIGYVNFLGYHINVDERVLIPRFETEMLVDETIKLINQKNIIPHIIDIGTGSGCIAIALSKELNVHVDAIDISKEALEVATNNALVNNADITFKNIDIKNGTLEPIYNVLISNPPYVSLEEEVDPHIKYEPQNAIYASCNGLEYYEIIIKRSLDFLTKPNIIAFEIGQTQTNAITAIAKNYYPSSNIIAKKDLTGRNRFLFIIND